MFKRTQRTTKNEGLSVISNCDQSGLVEQSGMTVDRACPIIQPNYLCQGQEAAESSNTDQSLDDFFHHLDAEILCFPDDPGRRTGKPLYLMTDNVHRSPSDCLSVWREYFAIRLNPVPMDVQQTLTRHTFNNWLHSDAQLLCYVVHMFVDLCLPEHCRFSTELLEHWLLVLYRRYNDVPFHNFKHAFTVFQMMYSVIKQARLDLCFDPPDLLILLFTALSHDLDHPGFSNSYQINAGSWLALRYNDQSPLENHHCAVAFDLISHSSTNILHGLSPSDVRWFRKAAVKLILSTDMSIHTQCVQKFIQILPELTANSDAKLESVNSLVSDDGMRNDHLTRLRQLFIDQTDLKLHMLVILLKVCDISNEVRPREVADPWLDLLFEEFFRQSDSEKEAGLPVATHMDRTKVIRSKCQVVFIANLLEPLLQNLINVFPSLKYLAVSASNRLDLYRRMLEKETGNSKLSCDEVGQSNTHRQRHEVLPITDSDFPATFAAQTPSVSLQSSLSIMQPIQADSRSSVQQHPVSMAPVIFPSTTLEDQSRNDRYSHDTPQSPPSIPDPPTRHQRCSLTGPNPLGSPLFAGLDDITDTDLLSEDAPSRKSSTGSMVAANG